MAMDQDPDNLDPTREALERMRGPVLLEFGTAWCTYCRAIRPQVAALLRRYPAVRHLTIEDGKGRPLGRSFQVKLWPTFVFLRDGQVVEQVSRPVLSEVEKGLQAIAGNPNA